MKPASRWIFILIATLAGAAVAQAQIYESKEKSGVPVFSDQPSPGSKEVTLPKPNISDAPMPSVQKPAIAPPAAYSMLSIVSPGPDGTVHSNTGAFSVTVNVVPALNSARGDRLMVKLDGTALPGRYTGPTIDLTSQDVAGAARNDDIQHQLEVGVVDARGNVVISADPVKFYLRRAVVQERGLERRVIEHHRAR